MAVGVPEYPSKELGQATDVSLRMSWGRLGLDFGKNQGIRKKEGKNKFAREFRQALGPSSWRWGGSQALLSFDWLGITSGDGYLSDHRANHVSVPDRPCLRGFLGWDRLRGKARVFACAWAGNNTAVWLGRLGGLKWRVGQPNRISDFHFSPCVPLQPSSTSQRDRHGFPRSPCGSSRHGMLSSALGWKQARDGLSEAHRACVAAFLFFFFSLSLSFFFRRKSSMNGGEGLRGRGDRLNLLEIQRCGSVCRYTNCTPAKGRAKAADLLCRRSGHSRVDTTTHVSRVGAAATTLATPADG